MNIARIIAAVLLFGGTAATGMAQTSPPEQVAEFRHQQPSRPASQTTVKLHLNGISAVQLAWWFQHIADDDGRYWKPLAPDANKTIAWDINPREDAHQLIGSVFHTEQGVGEGAVKMYLQFQDYVTNRRWTPGTAQAVFPSLAYPDDYQVPYPSPVVISGMGTIDPNSKVNGFNEQMLMTDGLGFSQGRILVSWVNTGADDTNAASGPVGIDVSLTLYQTWMEGPNRPASKPDGYYYDARQAEAITGAWKATLEALPGNLPAWFNADTQDDIARSKGWTITSVIDTGVVEGVDSKMWVWWWNHAMGDAPGLDYIFWCPPAHYAIRWLPGFSPADVLGTAKIPADRIVTGVIYPDLQLGDLVQPGGGMMSYPAEMAPIPGRYKTMNPMSVVAKEQIADFKTLRFPVPKFWLLHQWEDVPGGVTHRSSRASPLPLRSPVTQQGFYFEHQMMEGLFWGSSGMRKSYRKWEEAQKQ